MLRRPITKGFGKNDHNGCIEKQDGAGGGGVAEVDAEVEEQERQAERAQKQLRSHPFLLG